MSEPHERYLTSRLCSQALDSSNKDKEITREKLVHVSKELESTQRSLEAISDAKASEVLLACICVIFIVVAAEHGCGGAVEPAVEQIGAVARG